MVIMGLRLSCSKDELQQLLSKKLARKSVFLDIENPVLSLDDGLVRIACELNPAFSSRTIATIEFSVRLEGGSVIIELTQVAALVRPLGGVLGDWMFDGDWTKTKIMNAVERAINGRAGIACNGYKIYITPNQLDIPAVNVTGMLKMIKINPASITVTIE